MSHHPITNVYGSILVGSTHPYFEEGDNENPAGQEFEFSWAIEERELFWPDARTVHAFKSPLFRLPDVDTNVVSSTSRMEFQIEVPPFITDTCRIPCRFVLVSPPGDVVNVKLNGHSYILKNRTDKEGMHFMISADVLQKETRRSKFYAYEFHLRIAKEELEWNGFVSMPTPVSTASVAASADNESVGSSAASTAATASLRLPPSMLEDDRVKLTFSGTEEMINAKKIALCSQSERFREMMNAMVRGNRLKIPNEFAFATMVEIVRFLQYGFCEKWESMVEQIAAAAAYFKIDRLERLADHKRSLME